MRTRPREWLAIALAIATVGVALIRALSDDPVNMARQTRARILLDPEKIVAQTLLNPGRGAVAAEPLRE